MLLKSRYLQPVKIDVTVEGVVAIGGLLLSGVFTIGKLLLSGGCYYRGPAVILIGVRYYRGPGGCYRGSLLSGGIVTVGGCYFRNSTVYSYFFPCR